MMRLRRILCTALVLLALSISAAQAEETTAAFGREFSGQYAAYGEWITLRYSVYNTLSEPMTNVAVSDPLVGDVGYAARLEPHESLCFTARIRITADCLSSPMLSYEALSNSLALTAPQAQIILENAALSAVLEEKEEDNAHRLILTVTNEGNAPVYGLKVVDQLLGDMGPALPVLEAGESACFERAVDDSDTHQCHVTATSAARQTLKIESNSLKTQNSAPPGTGTVTLSARENNGQILLSIDNATGRTLEEAVLCEQTSNETRTLHFLPCGETTDILWPLSDSAAESEALLFELTLPGGDVFSAAPLVRSNMESDAASPKEDAALPDGLSFRLADNPQTYRDMMIGAALVLAGLIVVLWLNAARLRRRERRRRLKKRQEMRKKQRLNPKQLNKENSL